MKTGIVMKIKGHAAVVMKTGGEFVEVKAKEEWKIGDVVTLRKSAHGFKALYAAAACFVFFSLALLGGYGLYYSETSIISMDINPSLELSLNRFEKVISVTAYNEDAAELIALKDVQGLPFRQAIEALLQSDALQPFLENNEYLEFAVYTRTDNAEIVGYLTECVQSVCAHHNRIQAHCNTVDDETVLAARRHQMSIGKYLAFLELQALDPEQKADDFTNCGIDEIRNLIRQRNQNGNGGGSGHGDGDGHEHCHHGGGKRE